MGECWCCGLGNVAMSLCGHCQDAGCSRFDDHCKAADMDGTPLKPDVGRLSFQTASRLRHGGDH